VSRSGPEPKSHSCNFPDLNFGHRKLKAFQTGKPEEASKQYDDVDKSKYRLENPMLNEMTLRSLFAAEFLKNDGNNPVVYNRYYSPFLS
jgi:hypothetical protein